MSNNIVYPAVVSTQTFGKLQVNANSIIGSRPIANATVKITETGNPNSVVEEVSTDTLGMTDFIELPAPPIDYSLEPSSEQPYSEFNISVSSPGYEDVIVDGAQILPAVVSYQAADMVPLKNAVGEGNRLFVLPPHTLYGDYPPKIAEAEVKPINPSSEIVLSKVVIPEFIIVHDGPPSDPSAKNHYVRYKDYIKNVASSEIYATWPESTIQANVLAIMSFTLNRVYTEWYRNKGYSFTITSSTAFDHKWMSGRNIYDTISSVVDTIFTNYLSRPDVKQPILTQYCDGNRVQCPNWMTQWGSKYLGDQGYTAIEILRFYYGEDMYINTAEEVSGVPSSWPGYDLTIGSSGEKVRQMQNQLNVIAKNYPLIPKIVADGVYGEKTADAVKVFQKVFNLPQTGVVDFKTWYKISEIYVGVSRIAELS